MPNQIHTVNDNDNILEFDINDIKDRIFIDVILTFKEPREQLWFLKIVDYEIFKSKRAFRKLINDEFNENKDLLKVSMCYAYDDQLPEYKERSKLPKWYEKCNGKLFYGEWKK